MTPTEQKEKALAFLKALESPDPNTLADLITDNFEFEVMGRLPGLSPIRGKDAFVTTMPAMLKAMFPTGLNMKFHTVIAEGPHVAIQAESDTVAGYERDQGTGTEEGNQRSGCYSAVGTHNHAKGTVGSRSDDAAISRFRFAGKIQGFGTRHPTECSCATCPLNQSAWRVWSACGRSMEYLQAEGCITAEGTSLRRSSGSAQNNCPRVAASCRSRQCKARRIYQLLPGSFPWRRPLGHAGVLITAGRAGEKKCGRVYGSVRWSNASKINASATRRHRAKFYRVV